MTVEPANQAPSYTISSVISKDGTAISYRQIGRGPGIVLVHGGMQSAQNFMKLAEALADEFTLYLPDRRGRGLSGRHGNDYCIQKECEDIDALLKKTGAHSIFGLSSGAIISLQATLTLPAIHKAAFYEPPLVIDLSSPNYEFVKRYEREVSEGKLGAAFITIINGLQVSPTLSLIPRFIMVPLMDMGIKKEAAGAKEGEVTLKELVPTWHFDRMLVAETEGSLNDFKQISANVLLLSGSKSPAFLKKAVHSLSGILPHNKPIEFKGLDHMGPDNSGSPKIVAEALRQFFGNN